MPRTLTTTQTANLELHSSRPINIIRWEHSGTEELLSCSGPITYDSEAYSEGGINIKSIQDSRAASLSLPATPGRIAEVQNGVWRMGICQIYSIPGTPEDTAGYTTAEAVLVLDGVIVSSKYSKNSILVQIVHKNLDGNYTPRNVADEVCKHIPPPNTILSWEGDDLELESSR